MEISNYLLSFSWCYVVDFMEWKVEWYWIELLNWIIGLNWIELCKELNWIKLIALNYLFNELLIVIELKNWTYGIELFIIDLN